MSPIPIRSSFNWCLLSLKTVILNAAINTMLRVFMSQLMLKSDNNYDWSSYVYTLAAKMAFVILPLICVHQHMRDWEGVCWRELG